MIDNPVPPPDAPLFVAAGSGINVPPTLADAFDTVKQLVTPAPQADGGGGVAPVIVTVKSFCVDCCGFPLSCTRSVTVEVPAVVGVPLITPLAGFSVKPAGKVPELAVQVLLPVPPVASTVAL